MTKIVFPPDEDCDPSPERQALETRYIYIRFRLTHYDHEDDPSPDYSLLNEARAMSDDGLRNEIARLEKSVLHPH